MNDLKIYTKTAEVLKTGQNIALITVISTKISLENGTQLFIETAAELPMVFIFGAGHLACYIARYAKSLNF